MPTSRLSVSPLAVRLRCVQATLQEPLPVLIDKRPIADQHARPVRDELRKRFLGAGGMYLAVGDQWICHHPQPAPGPTGEPRGLINVINQGGAGVLSTSRVVKNDRCRDAIHHLLNRPLAQRYPKHGAPQVLHRTPARSHDARSLTDEACQPWTLATDLICRDLRVAQI